MSMKVKLIITTLIFLTAAMAVSAAEKQDLLFFYFESCPSCDQYIMAEDFSEQIEELGEKQEWNGASYNLVNPEGGKELKRVLQEKGLPDVSRSLPLLIIGSEYINGYDEIGGKLEDLLSKTEE